MRTNGRRLAGIVALLAWLLAVGSAGAVNGEAGPPETRRVLDIAVRVVDDRQGASSRRVRLDLRITNVGPTAVRLLSPRPGMLERYTNWGGWRLSILGPGGTYQAYLYPGAIEPHHADDIVTLRPNGSLSATIDVTEFLLDSSMYTGREQYLGRTKGEYLVSVAYIVESELVPRVKGDGFERITPMPRQEARAVAFTR